MASMNTTPSLRQQAAMRAGQCDTPTHETFPFPHTPHTPTLPHSLSALVGSDSANTPDVLANSARKQWRQHGSGMTQSLEEKRLAQEEQPGTVTVRILSADTTRRDVAGSRFTSYILRVHLANGQALELEHRYSEFAKLNEIFRNYNITVDAVFPSKHWAGRLGQWTPSIQWAPNQHDDLVQFRKVQLDVWLVHVVEKYNLGELPHRVHHAVFEFLTQSDRPPCDQENTTRRDDWTRWSNPLSFTLGSTIRQATETAEHMFFSHKNPASPTATSSASTTTSLGETDQSIPLDLLQSAKGLCFLTVIKGGLVVSGRVGTGLLIAKLNGQEDGPYPWSAPCALGTVGMGWGMLAGGDITHYLVVLTTNAAIDALLGGTVQLGAELGVAVGPVGRGATSQVAAGGDWSVHPAYSYAHSQGLFMGISLEGSVLTARGDVNAKFYGQHLPAGEILDLPPPKAAEPLYQALQRAVAMEIPEDGFRPSQLFQDINQKRDRSSRGQKGTTTAQHYSISAASQLRPEIDPVGRVAIPSMESPQSVASPM